MKICSLVNGGVDMADDKKVCFVITPIGDNNSEIRRHIDGIIDQAIEPALGDKYEIVVAHRKYEIGSINDRVIKSVYESDLVIANLTNTNPNVMFELAIRYSFGKPAIVIAEQGTKLPFDVIDENTIFYINDPAGANDLRQNIIEYEKNIDLEKKKYGPVFKVINKIPLYDEVESGDNVSSERLLQYVIDRLDSLEKNINIKTQDKSNERSNNMAECELEFTFSKNEPFSQDEVKELRKILSTYAFSAPKINVQGDALMATIITNKTLKDELLNDIKKWTNSNGNILFRTILKIINN